MNNNFGYLSENLPIDNGIINIIKIIDGIILSYKIDINRYPYTSDPELTNELQEFFDIKYD